MIAEVLEEMRYRLETARRIKDLNPPIPKRARTEAANRIAMHGYRRAGRWQQKMTACRVQRQTVKQKG